MTEPSLEERLCEATGEHAPLEDDILEVLLTELQTLRAEHDRLTTRIDDLEDTVNTLESERDALERTVDELEFRTESLECDHTDLDGRLETDETRLERLEALTEATRNRTGANKARLEELQARELEKGAHLREANVDVHEIDVADGRLERVTKTDGERYYRLPDHENPLDRSGTTALAHGDLLPIQQLARMDADMRRAATNSLPTRLAAKLWRARTDPAVSDDPWDAGCKSVDAYVKASDLKHWIRRQESGISDTYAKKLVSRTIDAILEYSNHRLAVRKRTERKNGLKYTERRLILPTNAEIPGETPTPSDADGGGPETTGVHG